MWQEDHSLACILGAQVGLNCIQLILINILHHNKSETWRTRSQRGYSQQSHWRNGEINVPSEHRINSTILPHRLHQSMRILNAILTVPFSLKSRKNWLSYSTIIVHNQWAIGEINVPSEHRINSTILLQRLHQSMWIFNADLTVLFSLKTSKKWQSYSTIFQDDSNSIKTYHIWKEVGCAIRSEWICIFYHYLHGVIHI